MPIFRFNPRIQAWASFAAVSHTGNTNETTLASITIPPMGPNDYLTIDALFSMTNNANNKTMRMRFGGTSIISLAVTTNGTYRFNYVLGNRNSTSSQVAGATPAFGGSSAASATSAIDTTAAVTLLFAGVLANAADTITLDGYRVEMLRP